MKKVYSLFLILVISAFIFSMPADAKKEKIQIKNGMFLHPEVRYYRMNPHTGEKIYLPPGSTVDPYYREYYYLVSTAVELQSKEEIEGNFEITCKFKDRYGKILETMVKTAYVIPGEKTRMIFISNLAAANYTGGAYGSTIINMGAPVFTDQEQREFLNGRLDNALDEKSITAQINIRQTGVHCDFEVN